jgi:DNA-directed RNA polymerase specialized sigma subunit
MLLATFYMLDNNNYSEREKLVIDLYKNQNKSIREIAKTAKIRPAAADHMKATAGTKRF